MKSELYVSNRKEWQSWLKKNHSKTKEIWLVYEELKRIESDLKKIYSTLSKRDHDQRREL